MRSICAGRKERHAEDRASAVDVEAGTVETPYFDAEDGTPLVDLKPYTPGIDCVERPRVPSCCAASPRSVEASGDFDQGAVFGF